MDEKGKIAKAAGKISVATFISRILGYIKDMILAFYFGATGLSDTFFAAFRIPNLLRELFAEGAMSAAFIPVLTEQRQKHGEEEAKRLVKITFTFILLAAGIVSVAGIFVAPGIVTVIVPGFPGEITRAVFPDCAAYKNNVPVSAVHKPCGPGDGGPKYKKGLLCPRPGSGHAERNDYCHGNFFCAGI